MPEPIPGWEDIDLKRFIFECQVLARAPTAVRRQIEDHGISLVPANLYFPVPLLADLPDTFEGAGDNRRPLYDRLFDSDLIREYLKSMAEFAGGLDPPLKGDVDNCTVKVGSDCLYIYLILMPSILKNLLVYSHDIYLSFGMPVELARDLQIHWTEQYLLYAYLLGDKRIRIIYGSCYAHNFFPELLTSLMAGKYGIGGGSLWYEINQATPP